MNEDITHRLNRIQGQIEAIKANINSTAHSEIRNCQDVLHQIKATRNALKKVGDEYITRYIGTCMQEANEQDTKQEQKERIEKILKIAFNT